MQKFQKKSADKFGTFLGYICMTLGPILNMWTPENAYNINVIVKNRVNYITSEKFMPGTHLELVILMTFGNPTFTIIKLELACSISFF